jgi:hypothetical protein
MMGKVRVEKEEFEVRAAALLRGAQRLCAADQQAVRAPRPRFALRLLSTSDARGMAKATFSKTLAAAMEHFFDEARGNLAESQARSGKSLTMMEAIYKKFSVEHGLKLGTPVGFSLLRYEKEIDRLDRLVQQPRQ